MAKRNFSKKKKKKLKMKSQRDKKISHRSSRHGGFPLEITSKRRRL